MTPLSGSDQKAPLSGSGGCSQNSSFLKKKKFGDKKVPKNTQKIAENRPICGDLRPKRPQSSAKWAIFHNS